MQLVLFVAEVQLLVAMLFQFDMAFVFCAWHYIWIVVGCHFVKLTVAIWVQVNVSDNEQFLFDTEASCGMGGLLGLGRSTRS